MAQKITIDLKKNPDVASVVADMEVGAPLEVSTTIASKDDQTLVLEVEDVFESSGAEEETEGEADESDDTATDDESEMEV